MFSTLGTHNTEISLQENKFVLLTWFRESTWCNLVIFCRSPRIIDILKTNEQLFVTFLAPTPKNIVGLFFTSEPYRF